MSAANSFGQSNKWYYSRGLLKQMILLLSKSKPSCAKMHSRVCDLSWLHRLPQQHLSSDLCTYRNKLFFFSCDWWSCKNSISQPNCYLAMMRGVEEINFYLSSSTRYKSSQLKSSSPHILVPRVQLRICSANGRNWFHKGPAIFPFETILSSMSKHIQSAFFYAYRYRVSFVHDHHAVQYDTKIHNDFHYRLLSQPAL